MTKCGECGCTTGGGAFCYAHAPYQVLPLKDGSYYVDRGGGRSRVWLEPPSHALIAEAEARGREEVYADLRRWAAEVMTQEEKAAAFDELWARAHAAPASTPETNKE